MMQDLKFSLPVIMFTHGFLDLCKKHELSRIPILLALCMLGNMDASRGFIHKFKVKDRARELGCCDAQIYISIRILRDLGFANLKLRHGKVSGRILAKDMLPSCVLDKWKSGKLSEEDLCGHSMPVGMIHHLALASHISGETSGGHLRLMLACCLNVDVQTGVLHEKRPCEWADLSGIHRTWASKGFSHFNEIGVSQTKTDYDVMGRFPFVALANGVFQQMRLAKAEGRKDSKDRMKEKLLALYECLGIDLKGIAHEIIENAWRLLGEDVDKLRRESLQKFADLMGREAPASDRRRVFEGVDRETLPIREHLSFA